MQSATAQEKDLADSGQREQAGIINLKAPKIARRAGHFVCDLVGRDAVVLGSINCAGSQITPVLA